MKHYLTPTEYIKLMRSVASLADAYEYDTLRLLLIELGKATEEDGIYAISDALMARIAIINMCNMTQIQHRDSNGEIDYAYLGRHSEDVVENLIRNIYYFVP